MTTPASAAFRSYCSMASRTIASIRAAASSTAAHRPAAGTCPLGHARAAGAASAVSAPATAHPSNVGRAQPRSLHTEPVTELISTLQVYVWCPSSGPVAALRITFGRLRLVAGHHPGDRRAASLCTARETHVVPGLVCPQIVSTEKYRLSRPRARLLVKAYGRGEDASHGRMEEPSSGDETSGIGRWVHGNLLVIGSTPLSPCGVGRKARWP